MTDTTDPIVRKDSVLTDVSQLVRDAEAPEWTTQDEDEGLTLRMCFATVAPTWTSERTVRRKVVTDELDVRVFAEQKVRTVDDGSVTLGETRIMLDGLPDAIHDNGLTIGAAKTLIAALAQVLAAAEQDTAS